jgi:hypothetical protein
VATGRARWLPLLLVGLAVAVVGIRLVADARAAFREGAAAADRGATEEAIRGYADAIRLYVPGSPYARAGLERLEALAAAAEGRGELETARHALEAARGALLGTRSFYTPFADRLPALTARLARLLAALEGPRVAPGATAEARIAWHAERLARPPGPAPAAALAALVGFAIWLGAAVAFFTRGLDRGLRLRRGPATAAAVVFGVGVALFLAGLRLA